MPNRDGAGRERRARSSSRTGRPSRWRAASDAGLRQQEGVAAPGEAGPDVVGELLRERLLDGLSGGEDEAAQPGP